MRKIYFLISLGILLITLSCRTETDSIDSLEHNVENSKKFSVFYRNSIFARNADLNYAEAFAYLAQRYDAVNRTNITGLVNTTNDVNFNKLKKQRFISKSSDAYIEFRLHSQTIYDKNGDLWVLSRRLKMEELSI